MMLTLLIVLAVLFVAFCGVMVAILRIGSGMDNETDNTDDSDRTD